MDYSIRQLAGAMVAELAELQSSDQFARLLNCPETELREEALGLYIQINALKTGLDNIS
jgi:hypothetical protein